MILFENVTANSTSPIFPGTDKIHSGGPVSLAITGTFDGATIHIEVNQDNIGFVRLRGVDQTQTDVNKIFLGNAQQLRLVLTGAGASTDLTASVVA